MVDYVGAFEDLNGSYNHVCEKVGIPTKVLESINGSKHGDYSQYLDPELKQQVLDYYKFDIELLNY